MDPAPVGGDGRRRGKKNRNNKGRKKKPGKGRGQRSSQAKGWTPPETSRDDISVLGGRVPRSTDGRPPLDDGAPDAFVLFCAYHLGITSDDGYMEPRADDVARRFRISSEQLQKELKKHGLDEQTMRRSSFDLKGAKLDIRLCPEGISRTESARELFEEYQASNAS